jgi:hypothetical protein
MKTCELCQSQFPSYIIIDGKKRNLKNRKYCLTCSPWGEHNTIKRTVRKHSDCIICHKKLKDTQLKFCSKECKKESHSRNNRNWYPVQKKRGQDRKKELVLIKGGKCECCSYDKNLSALEFHHRDPNDKVSELDSRILSNRTWEFCLEEAEKCLLLCSNCHREHHCPDFNDWKF